MTTLFSKVKTLKSKKKLLFRSPPLSIPSKIKPKQQVTFSLGKEPTSYQISILFIPIFSKASPISTQQDL